MAESTPVIQLSVGVRNFAARPPADWRHILDHARAADEVGIDRVFVADHLVLGDDLSAYGDPRSGGVRGGVQPTSPDGDWLEPLAALSAMAAVTDRVLLATNVLVAPLRAATVLAKTAATIDALSHGRFELGVGVGWQEAEYRAVGVDFATRGAVLDETLAACQELWTSPVARFTSDRFVLDRVHMMPKPVRSTGVPVWIGGSPIASAARRIAKYGAGWIPWGATPSNFAQIVARMRALVEAEGRDFGTVQLSYAIPTVLTSDKALDIDTMFQPVSKLLAEGVTDFRVMPRLPADYRAARQLLDDLNESFRLVTVR